MNDRRRVWLSIGVIAAFGAMLVATSKPRDEKEKEIDSGSSLPADVDMKFVIATVACDKKPDTAGCKLLREFDAAEGGFLELPATRIIWFGEAIALVGPLHEKESTDGAREAVFVTVEKSDGGFGASVRALAAEGAKEKTDADDLRATLESGDAAAPANDAAMRLRGAPAPTGGLLPIVKTRGRSHALVESQIRVYLRRAANRLLVLECTGWPIVHERVGGTTVPPKTATCWIAQTWLVK